MAEQTTIKQEFAKLKQNQLFLIIGILLFAVVMFWVAVNLFTSQQQTRITAEQTRMAAPLQPTIDTSVIEVLANKPFYSESELANFTIYKLIQGSDGQKYVVPIDTLESEFLETEATNNEDIAEPVNLFEALNTPEESTASDDTNFVVEEEENETDETEAEPEESAPEATEDSEAEN